jgi:hypothetical protein
MTTSVSTLFIKPRYVLLTLCSQVPSINILPCRLEIKFRNDVNQKINQNSVCFHIQIFRWEDEEESMYLKDVVWFEIQDEHSFVLFR